VASDATGLERLAALYDRCQANALEPELLTGSQLTEREPRIVGKGAIFVSASGIVDYAAIARKMASEIAAAGGKILTSETVVGIREEKNAVTVETTAGTRRAAYLVACGGLHADRLAMMCGLDPDFRIVPFRGEYFRLVASRNDVVKHLIYPVPDPSLPFLGVHLTRMIGGYVTVGPNAVLALAREGYNWSQFSLGDMAELTAFPGFWRMLGKHRGSAVRELRNSISPRAYLKECRRYCPELSLEDFQPHPAGVRAQAVLRDGTLAHDFMIRNTQRTLHVCNAPSPAATSALPIGHYLTDQCSTAFGWV
jgi:L-2-hydroxyglutarate oxidase